VRRYGSSGCGLLGAFRHGGWLVLGHGLGHGRGRVLGLVLGLALGLLWDCSGIALGLALGRSRWRFVGSVWATIVAMRCVCRGYT
jgi:hypothetical protein